MHAVGRTEMRRPLKQSPTPHNPRTTAVAPSHLPGVTDGLHDAWSLRPPSPPHPRVAAVGPPCSPSAAAGLGCGGRSARHRRPSTHELPP
uniref:Uncharacterized protein n=1 Tax=Oryza meridionalis TaxID=40149 RepID=A0A0E0E3V3_9ORYZ